MARLLRFAEIDFPLNPSAAFGRAGPLVLEIGFGDGRFLVTLARAHPDWNLLGVEAAAASVARALRRLVREGVEPVRLFKGRAGFAVRNLVPPRSLHAVYVNFPDPWPKSRHAERRLLREPFFRLLSTRLEAKGRLLLTTDHEDYFAFALEEAKRSGLFEAHPQPPPSEVLTTKYAEKWKERGRRFFHAVFVKVAEAGEDFPPLRKEDEMPHAILEGSLPELGDFAKRVHAFPGGHAIFLEAARRAPEGYYFLVRVEEPELELIQELLLELRPSAHGLYAGLKRFGDPLVTPGVRHAVGFLVDWLAARGLKVQKRSY